MFHQLLQNWCFVAEWFLSADFNVTFDGSDNSTYQHRCVFAEPVRFCVAFLCVLSGDFCFAHFSVNEFRHSLKCPRFSDSFFFNSYSFTAVQVADSSSIHNRLHFHKVMVHCGGGSSPLILTLLFGDAVIGASSAHHEVCAPVSERYVCCFMLCSFLLLLSPALTRQSGGANSYSPSIPAPSPSDICSEALFGKTAKLSTMVRIAVGTHLRRIK